MSVNPIQEKTLRRYSGFQISVDLYLKKTGENKFIIIIIIIKLFIGVCVRALN